MSVMGLEPTRPCEPQTLILCCLPNSSTLTNGRGFLSSRFQDSNLDTDTTAAVESLRLFYHTEYRESVRLHSPRWKSAPPVTSPRYSLRDSNPHLKGFKPSASAVGLREHMTLFFSETRRARHYTDPVSSLRTAYSRWDSNPQSSRHQFLKLTCIPFHHWSVIVTA